MSGLRAASGERFAVTVRLKIALTILITGLLTAAGVIATVVVAFQRFEHETAYDRANVFLGRVVATYDNLFDLQDRYPDELNALLRNLLLFEADTQLYLLNAEGVVLSSTGDVKLPAGFKVALGPVRQATQGNDPARRMPYVMGDDPERMDAGAVIAARALSRAVIRPNEPMAGYLYLVTHKQALPGGRLAVFRSAFGGPALAAVAGVVALTTLMAAWIIAAVTRPLRRISAEVARASREGLGAGLSDEAQGLLRVAPTDEGLSGPAGQHQRLDEFGQLREGFRAMLTTLRMQWEALRRLDQFRREGVSNLSHDLRSPLTATVACLETLDQRWASDMPQGDRADDRRLIAMALRNTRNAAQLVRSLGDLAQLDEPEFKLHTELLDLSEVLDDIALRFAERAAQRGVSLHYQHDALAAPPFAEVDIELLERAIANLLDNALKFTPPGGQISLAVSRLDGAAADAAAWVNISVADTGSGIADKDLPRLFDRLYQSRDSVAPASSEGGKGLGLAIVKRIAELHRGSVAVRSDAAQGTCVTLTLPGIVTLH
ncbi:MAG: HAMP domain-containing sensor histidine kinase [Polaromonas sp.]